MFHNFAPQQIDLLRSVMEEQVKKPARAVVNSESAFVRTKLLNLGEPELSKKYWGWAIRPNPVSGVFPPEIDELQRKLNAIDRSASMPDWGTHGT